MTIFLFCSDSLIFDWLHSRESIGQYYNRRDIHMRFQAMSNLLAYNLPLARCKIFFIHLSAYYTLTNLHIPFLTFSINFSNLIFSNTKMLFTIESFIIFYYILMIFLQLQFCLIQFFQYLTESFIVFPPGYAYFFNDTFFSFCIKSDM